jgi:hypothetical protein
MQICVLDVFSTNFFSFTCHDTISTYDITLISPLVATSDFCQYKMHDTIYDTSTVASLSR